MAILVGAGAAGCTFAPVYGEHGLAETSLAIAYGEPGNRLEQVIYQELGLRLGTSTAPDAPRVTVAASRSSRDLTRTATANPSDSMEMTVSAEVTVVRDGELVFSGTRSASALYSTNSQVLANKAAEADAAERAARAVAESIRLSLIAVLAGQPAGQ